MLKDEAKRHGAVDHADVMMEPDGKSKGYGIVKCRSVADAERVIAGMNGLTMEGRQLVVHEDRDASIGGMDRRSPPRGGGGGGRPGVLRPAVARAGASTRLFVGNLSWGVTWQMLKDLFKEVRGGSGLLSGRRT